MENKIHAFSIYFVANVDSKIYFEICSSHKDSNCEIKNKIKRSVLTYEKFTHNKYVTLKA